LLKLGFTAEAQGRRGVLVKKSSFSASLRLRGKRCVANTRMHAQGGFTYVMVLAAVVVVGILADAAVTLSSRVTRAEREAELLFRGQAYQRAIQSYYMSGPSTKTYPRNLEDLVKDPRFPNKRHLRALYPDPMSTSGKGEWFLIRATDGGISGVASASTEEPFKKTNFPKGLEKFDQAKSYTDWVFEYVPIQMRINPTNPMAAPPVTPPAPNRF
jgi:type II secretory pathway pseudopilin PulG